MTHQPSTNGKLLSEEEADCIAAEYAFLNGPFAGPICRGSMLFGSACNTCDKCKAEKMMPVFAKGAIPALLADRQERIEQNRNAIEKIFAKMCKLDTPKRGELHLLMIALLSQ